MKVGMRAGWLMLAFSVATVLAGCGPLMDPHGTMKQAATVTDDQNTADAAMTALSHGDTATAERASLGALRKNPKDPFALLAAGLTFQTTGRTEQARQYYQVIITNNLPGTMMLPGETGVVRPHEVVDVAKANLAMIDKPAGGRGTVAQAGRDAPPPMAGDAEANVAGRFRILKKLLDQGLVTPEEYSRRRSANLGALLPFSAPPPARGLERPVPADNAVVDRLRALAAAVENREMLPASQAEERGIILDALLPAQPANAALPPLAPRDLLEEGQAVGRLERMRTAGLVSPDEAARERQALDQAYQLAMAGQAVEGSATGLRYGTPGPATPQVQTQTLAAPDKSTGWGVSLGTAKSEAAANHMGEQVKAKFPVELGERQFTTRKVSLRGRGTRWRVIAGPLESREAAAGLCRVLKLHRQGCDPVQY